jgi:tetratricopeptide (TPR) repeat protein
MRISSLMKFILFLAVCALMAGSYYFSQPVYRFYLTAYYLQVRKFTPETVRKHTEELLREKRHDECDSFLRSMLIVFFNDRSVIRTAGKAYMQMGKKQEGIALMVSAIDAGEMSAAELKQTLPELLEQGYYPEIKSLVRGRNDLDEECRFIHGVALYRTGEHEKAAAQLRKALEEGYAGESADFYLAMSLDKINRVNESIPFMEKAYKRDTADRNIRQELARLYRKAGHYEKAAKLLGPR